VDELVLRMLAKQPHKRFDGMEELRRVLAGIERGVMVALDGPTAAPPSKSYTAMFEDAPTRAVMRDSTPGSTPGAAPVRVSLNTAPAGSGTLAQLEAQARLPSTVILEEDASVHASGGTMVVHGQSIPAAFDGAGTPGSSFDAPPLGRDGAAGIRGAMPPRVVTVPTPVPRPLPGLAASPAAPRLTRISVPGERDEGSGMMRGVGAAFGGIALAVAVMVGWVLYTRYASNDPAPTPPPAAAAIVVDDGSEPAAEAAAAEGAIEPGAEEPGEAIVAEGELAKDDAAPVEPEAVEPEAVEGEAVAEPQPEGSVDGPVGSEPVELDAKSKKRRGKTKTDDTKQPEVVQPETDPEPQPEVPKKKKSGDLRDPF
jgi:hypothetical protein